MKYRCRLRRLSKRKVRQHGLAKHRLLFTFRGRIAPEAECGRNLHDSGQISAAHLRTHTLNPKVNPVSGDKHGDIRGHRTALMPDDQRAFDIRRLDIAPRNEGPRLNQLAVHLRLLQLERHAPDREGESLWPSPEIRTVANVTEHRHAMRYWNQNMACWRLA